MTETVYIYGPVFSTFVRSVMLCCEEKGIAYQVGSRPFGQRIDYFSDAHAALNPHKLFPILIHGDLRLCETAPICRYLDRAFPGVALQPTDNIARAQVDQWSQDISLYIYDAIARNFLLERVFPKGPDGTVRDAFITEQLPNLQYQLQRLSTQLADQPYLCGQQLSLADVILYPLLDSLVRLPDGRQMLDVSVNLSDYLSRLQQRPSAQAIRRQQEK
ncbi:MAG: glutathione S-transferase family protein [Gammaproteobacteria bacterium]|nr:glutathione S-transferase family protein [Gammaproteobacteria bacterium]